MTVRRLLWQGADSPWWTVAVVVCVITAAALVVTLHSYERRLITRRLGMTLLGLRIAVLALLFLVLLEPVLSWTLSQERTGRVVLAIDGSLSMETVDVQATPAEKLLWARAIGLIGNPGGDSRLDRWIASYAKGQTPEWATADEERDPAKRQLLADARRQNVETLLGEMDGFSRKDLVQRLLAPGRDGLLKQLEKNVSVEMVVFGGSSVETAPSNLGATLAQPPQLMRAGETDLSQAIAAAQSVHGEGKLEGIILLTDGRNSQSPARRGSESSSSAATPLYPVVMGSDRKPKDLAIAVLESPPSAFLHDKPVVRATLRTSGFTDTDVTVELQRTDVADSPPERKVIRPTGATANVEFAIDAEEVGRRRYRLTAVSQPEETRSDNNERQFTLQVVDDKARLLILDGEPRWEFRYLETALHRDERVEVDAIVFRQPFMGLLPDTFFPRVLTLPEDFRQSEESPFSRYDLVIVGDVTPQQMPEEAWRWLDRYVRDEGGTLVMAAGKRSFPMQHRSDVVQSLLPVVDLAEQKIDQADDVGSPRERGFGWQITPEGAAFDVLRFAQNDDENRTVWNDLPGHSWGLVGTAKPGATVWAAARVRGMQPGLQWDKTHALFAQHYVGAGQVVWLGVDSTWRWRYGIGDAYHHRFWGQLARWAADFKSSVGNEFVKFGIERPSLATSEETTIRARWDARFLKKNPQLKSRARVFRVDNGIEEEAALIELKPVEGRPLIAEGRVSRLKAGEYRVRLEAEGAELGAAPIQAELLVTEPLTPELADVSANPEGLAALAQNSGGRLFTAADVADLPQLFEKSAESFERQEQIAVWNHWAVLAILFALLTTEWVLRKLNGLP